MRVFFAYLLFPLSILYGVVVYIRNFLFDVGILKSYSHKTTTISIGNLIAGGSGKTPMVEYLIQVLSPHYNIAVLSAGYKRKRKGFLIIDQKKDNAIDVGDEPLQIKLNNPNIVVAICKDRNKGIALLEERIDNLDIIILDDCFQFRKLKPTISILLTEYKKPYFKDKILPFGLLREQKQGYKRANYIVVTKTKENLSLKDRKYFIKNINPKKEQKVFFSNIVYKEPYFLFDEEIKESLENKNTILITAIANNYSIITYLEKASKLIKTIKYEDHHIFNRNDIERIVELYNLYKGNTIIITTQKDATKLKLFDKLKDLPIYVLPIETQILDKDDTNAKFNNIIEDDIRKNKRNSPIFAR
ncbi:MAG: tetraacyldisaccharide 4'-kinase [Bacteroidales bacterium]|jgi:tetraacyldisaccharide 4'-kinase|nr:tetraacyldisaccharide 4'-kinase [Bacteroidales bacterium]